MRYEWKTQQTKENSRKLRLKTPDLVIAWRGMVKKYKCEVEQTGPHCLYLPCLSLYQDSGSHTTEAMIIWLENVVRWRHDWVKERQDKCTFSSTPWWQSWPLYYFSLRPLRLENQFPLIKTKSKSNKIEYFYKFVDVISKQHLCWYQFVSHPPRGKPVVFCSCDH